MRLRLPIAAATALFATQPAAAGIVAHYRISEGPEQRLMVVEVNDRGDGRADMGSGAGVLLMLGGTPYVVDSDAEGTYVARLEDSFALSMAAWNAADRSPPGDPSPDPKSLPPSPPRPPPPQVKLIRGGTEIVAGRIGTVWRIQDPADPARDEEFVVGADPDLAPLNGMIGPSRPAGGVRNPDPAFDPNGAFAARAAIRRQGTILREGRIRRLERVEIHPMSGAFALPGPVLSRQELAARALRTGPRRLP